MNSVAFCTFVLRLTNPHPAISCPCFLVAGIHRADYQHKPRLGVQGPGMRFCRIWFGWNWAKEMGAVNGKASIKQHGWICGALLALSFLCFSASFVLSLEQRDNSLAFWVSGLVLALWSSLTVNPRGVCAEDVVALIKEINPLSRR